MNNPLKKKAPAGLIIAAAVTAVAAGALAYLYLTKNGEDARHSLKRRAKEEVKDFASGFISRKTGLSKTAIKKFADHIF